MTDSSAFQTKSSINTTYDLSGNKLENKNIQQQTWASVWSQNSSTNDAQIIFGPSISATTGQACFIPTALASSSLPNQYLPALPLTTTDYLITNPNISQQSLITLGLNEPTVPKSDFITNVTRIQFKVSPSSCLSSNTKNSFPTNIKEGNSIFATENIKPSPTISTVIKNTDAQGQIKNAKPVNETFCFVCNITCESVEFLRVHKEGNNFFCRVCAQSFDEHDKLEIHSKEHKPYTCSTCKDVFFTKKDILDHKKINQECRNVVDCEICNKTIAKKSIKQHLKNLHREKKAGFFECFICGKSFNSTDKLKRHFEFSHDAYELIECHVCNKLLVGPHKLKLHKSKVHLNPVENNSFISCDICQKLFTTGKGLEQHKNTHDDTERLCELCGDSVKGKNMSYHLLKYHSKKGSYICEKCGETFDSFYKKKLHSKKHRKSNGPLYCEICGKKYKNSSVLKKHYAIHSDERPFKCETCGASFKQAVALGTHKRVHSSVGKYFCSGCGKSFNWKQTLMNHVNKCKNSQDNDDQKH